MPQDQDMVLTLDGLTNLLKYGSTMVRELVSENERLHRFERAVDLISRMDKIGFVAGSFPPGLSLSEKAKRLAALPEAELDKMAFSVSQAQRQAVLGSTDESSRGQSGGLTGYLLSRM